MLNSILKSIQKIILFVIRYKDFVLMHKGQIKCLSYDKTKKRIISIMLLDFNYNLFKQNICKFSCYSITVCSVGIRFHYYGQYE